MKRSLELERIYPHPRALVWSALSDPELLATWLMPNDFVAEIGHEFTFRTDPAPGFDGIVHCKVVDMDPERLMRWSWRGGSIDTTVTFRLEDAILYSRPATRLVLEHTGFDGLPAVLTSFILGAGWAAMLRKKIPLVLERMARGETLGPTHAPKANWRASWWWLAKLFSPILRRNAK
ncbi:SRPBCC domain-containing protein [Pendulispora albinea]|uniref:SRPBCC domain-containing protein n=1 Tax=Pendulispora albinea TaxID=2741071 RepID=A0ABZ2M048_9BACT